jgi:hypothetical protein
VRDRKVRVTNATKNTSHRVIPVCYQSIENLQENQSPQVFGTHGPGIAPPSFSHFENAISHCLWREIFDVRIPSYLSGVFGGLAALATWELLKTK